MALNTLVSRRRGRSIPREKHHTPSPCTRSSRMSRKSSRREFMQTTALAGVGYFVAAGVTPRESRAANEQIAFASIGVEGKGGSDSGDAGSSGDMVAICDVDEASLDKAKKRFPKAKAYYDYRKMLE